MTAVKNQSPETNSDGGSPPIPRQPSDAASSGLIGSAAIVASNPYTKVVSHEPILPATFGEKEATEASVPSGETLGFVPTAVRAGGTRKPLHGSGSPLVERDVAMTGQKLTPIVGKETFVALTHEYPMAPTSISKSDSIDACGDGTAQSASETMAVDHSAAGEISVDRNGDVECQRDGAEAGKDDDDTLTHGGSLVLDVLRVGVGSDAGRGFGVARDHDGFPPNESHQQTTEGMVPCLTIPPGWKLVPEEPTEEMKVAGEVSEIRDGDAAAIYRAMLAASPQPLKAVAPCGNNGDKDP